MKKLVVDVGCIHAKPRKSQIAVDACVGGNPPLKEIPGIYQVDYIMPAPGNTAATVDGVKTVYNASEINGEQFESLARDAGQIVYQDALDGSVELTNNRADVVVEGITFRVYLNTDRSTGNLVIGTVFPFFP